ncbi:MAG: hypothetical protein II947_05475, partial [Bacteroidaceae bacterium]|nr:hypothetical protein [Bacteroidaceae bacterium]
KEYVLESGALVLYFPFTLLYVMERSEDLDGVAMTVDLESVQPLLVKLTATDTLLTIRSNPLTVLDEKPFAGICGLHPPLSASSGTGEGV